MTVTQTGLLEHGPSLRKSTASSRRTACVGQRVAHNGFCHAQSGRCSATCVCNQCRAVACHQAVLGRVHHRGRGRRCLGASKLGSAAREVLVAQFRNNSASQASFVSLFITLASDSRLVAGSPIFQLSGTQLLCCRAERTHWIRDVSRSIHLPCHICHLRIIIMYVL